MLEKRARYFLIYIYIFRQNIFKRFDNFTKFAKSILTVTWPHFLLTVPNAFKRSFEPKQFLCCFELFIHIHVNHIGIKLSTVQCPQCMPPFSLILANPATTWWTSILSSRVFFLLAWQILLNIHLSKYHWLICKKKSIGNRIIFTYVSIIFQNDLDSQKNNNYRNMI